MTRILVIEDENDIREAISDILRFEGFAVAARSNGADGILAALEIHPDLILSDIMMPQVDGIQVLQELRKANQTRSTPLIFLTARAERAMMRQAMELGADDYLVKPFTHEELLAAVYARLEKHKVVQDMVDKHTTAKQQFVRLIAHELRTPLTTISMVYDLLDLYFRDLSDSEVRELVNSLGRGTHRLRRVVEQIVCMVELESGLMPTRPRRDVDAADYLYKQDVATVIAAAIKLGRKLAPQNQKLEIQADVHNPTLLYTMIEGNISKLIYALGELISNALTFSKPGGHVQVRFRSDSSLAQFSIIDHGHGMSESDIQRATQPFEQIDRRHHGQQGLGLGLFLVSRIVEQHHGHLSIRSEVNQGTEVTVKLPFRQKGD
jgi:signal transduction histidine kinase